MAIRPTTTTKASKGRATRSRTASRPKATRSAAQEPDKAHVEELLLQALETEMGGVLVYETAIKCASNEELREEWEKYLEETREHERIVRQVCEVEGIDPEKQTPGRQVVNLLGHSLVEAMTKALDAGDPMAAQVVAAECVVLAETKDHLNWELIGEVVEARGRQGSQELRQAFEEIEDQEDEHLYHTKGWARELWLEHLGLPAVVPPPEERKHVKSAIGQARAEAGRKKMLRGGRKGGRRQGTQAAEEEEE
jgi:rubrerythrin